MAKYCRTLYKLQIGQTVSSSGTRTNIALNNAYVHLTSGPAVACRFLAQTADPINEFYIFLDANGGTLGNITMEAKVYNENGSFATRPGSTLRATSTVTTMPGAVDHWIKFTFGTPYTPAVGEILWIVAYNTSVSPTVDFPNIITGTTGLMTPMSTNIAYTVTTGFSANGSALYEMPRIIKQGLNYFGQPFTQLNSAYYASNQRKRGIQFTLPVPMYISGVELLSGTSAWNKVQIFDDVTAPGGIPLYEYNLDSDVNELTGDLMGVKVFDAPILLSVGTYKCVVTFTVNSTTPQVCQIEDYASYPAIFDALFDDNMLSLCPSVIDNNVGGWTINKGVMPSILLYIDSIPSLPTPAEVAAATWTYGNRTLT